MTSLTDIWPAFGLILTTPRLQLKPVQDTDLPALLDAARSGIHEPGRNPFGVPWTEVPEEELGPNMARWHWTCRSTTTPEKWTLLLGIWHDGEIIGCQDVSARNFNFLKTVGTGSWLKQSIQGRGLGKEMRAAVVSYAFDHLGAEVAESEAAAWNEKSLGVSRSLGYELNGTYRTNWGPKVEEVQRVRLTPETFKRPDWTLKVEGHELFAKFLGIHQEAKGDIPTRRDGGPSATYARARLRPPVGSASPTRAQRRSPSDRSGAAGGV